MLRVPKNPSSDNLGLNKYLNNNKEADKDNFDGDQNNASYELLIRGVVQNSRAGRVNKVKRFWYIISSSM